MGRSCLRDAGPGRRASTAANAATTAGIALAHQDHVDVAGVVELLGAELSHADDGQPVPAGQVERSRGRDRRPVPTATSRRFRGRRDRGGRGWRCGASRGASNGLGPGHYGGAVPAPPAGRGGPARPGPTGRSSRSRSRKGLAWPSSNRDRWSSAEIAAGGARQLNHEITWGHGHHVLTDGLILGEPCANRRPARTARLRPA